MSLIANQESFNVLEHVADDGSILNIRVTMHPARLEGETFEEFKFRRSLIKDEIKRYKRGVGGFDPYPNGAFAQLDNGGVVKVKGECYKKVKENGDNV